ncbi:MAG TPA: CoA transferase, partial [Allosphingosinicella sp.]|nr:CoA transferase [Allosphingosinicella sp.]
PRRLGNAHPNIAPYQTFAAADGHLIVAVGNDAQFRRLCTLLGQPALGEDPRFAANAGRVRDREHLATALAPLLGQRRRDELLAALAAAGIPAGPINDVAEVFADPQVVHRGLRIDRGGLPGVASPIVIDGRRQVSDRPSPVLDGITATESTS